MPVRKYFSYVRVSTQRQGLSGTSLSEQILAIERYARRWNLSVIKQFEERETAAKAGRPVFLEMLKALRAGTADGLIVHKIDRSARNLKDWAELGALIDLGIELHFANESLDLNSRGGRLSADIQAVVAADFIRNLREETKKGIYGRIRQGLYPFPARVGYVNAGKGKPKEVDPVQAPLVRRAFELYAAGGCGLNRLVEEMYELGLRNKNDRKISRNGLCSILKNPFYTGLIKIQKSGEVFAGQHQPIISQELFERVQRVFAGKNVKKQNRHFFVFRRSIRCRRCRRLLIAERQKGYCYYRCQTEGCPQKCLREEVVADSLLKIFQTLRFSDLENEYLKEKISQYEKRAPQTVIEAKQALAMRAEQIRIRLDRLADAYMDEVFDKEIFLEKKNTLTCERHQINEKIKNFQEDTDKTARRMAEFLELANSAYASYKLASEEEKREIVEIMTSNFTADGKTVLIELKKPFQIIHDRARFPAGSPTLAASRTLSALLNGMLDYFRENRAG